MLEHEYHLSRFHRDLLTQTNPDLAAEYEDHHRELRWLEGGVERKQREIRRFITSNKLKAAPKPAVYPEPNPQLSFDFRPQPRFTPATRCEDIDNQRVQDLFAKLRAAS